MADVSKIFKPRRGTASIMAGTKKSTVLASGELFVEVPNTGVGTGASKIKIGDGTTAYSSLPYALGDTSNDKINFSSNTSTTVAAALNSVVTGASLKNIVAGLKQAISLCNTSITQLNDDISEAGGIGMTSTQAEQLNEIYTNIVIGSEYDANYNSTFICSSNMQYASGLYNVPCIWIPNQFADFAVLDKSTSSIECLKDGTFDLHFTFGGKFNAGAELHLYINSEMFQSVPVVNGTVDGSIQSQDATNISLYKGDIISVNFYRKSGNYCGVAGLSIIFTKQ